MLPLFWDPKMLLILPALAHGGYLEQDDLSGARKVLQAAALTYVAAAAMAILQLVRMLVLAGRRD